MKETLEDFLARGGAVNRLPEAPRSEHQHVLPVRVSSAELMDLDSGAHLYSEAALDGKPARGVKPKTSRARAPKINASLIPKSLLGLMQKVGIPYYEEKREAAAERE